MKKSTAKVKNKTIAKKRAWAAVSKYVRTLHSRNGLCTCYTCGDTRPISEMQAGHAIQGRGNSILFETDGIRPQCAGCNVWQHGRLDIFVPRLIDDIGRQRYDELLALKGKEKKYSKEDYLEIESEYKQKLIEIGGLE